MNQLKRDFDGQRSGKGATYAERQVSEPGEKGASNQMGEASECKRIELDQSVERKREVDDLIRTLGDLIPEFDPPFCVLSSVPDVANFPVTTGADLDRSRR